MDDPSEAEQGAYDENGVWRAQFDWSSTLPSTAVVETVAAAVGCDPTDLEPLYDYVDPDALDTLIINALDTLARDGDPTPPSGGTTIGFGFADYDVTVYTDGEVAVRPLD